VTGGYPNEAVFWGSDLAMSTREKRLDINPIVRKARMAEHCDIVPFRMIGETRIECRYASSQRKSTGFEPTYYPQSNGKIERWHNSLKGECIRPGTPLSLEDARRLVEGYVEHYNNVRLNSAIGYITPKDMLAGHQQEVQAERDRKLDAAKEQRKNRRQGAA